MAGGGTSGRPASRPPADGGKARPAGGDACQSTFFVRGQSSNRVVQTHQGALRVVASIHWAEPGGEARLGLRDPQDSRRHIPPSTNCN